MCAGTWRSGVLCVLLLVFAGAAAPAAGAAVALNEVNCEGTDWVELVNTVGRGRRPLGLAADRRPDRRHPGRPPLRLPGGHRDPGAGQPRGGARARRASRSASAAAATRCGWPTRDGALVEEVAVPDLTNPADTWGRYPNATGPWVQTASTKGAPNQPSSSGPPAEQAPWLFDPAGGRGGPRASRRRRARRWPSSRPSTRPATFCADHDRRDLRATRRGRPAQGRAGSFRPADAERRPSRSSSTTRWRASDSSA